MGFYRQLDTFVIVSTTLLVFVECVFFGLPVKFAAIVAGGIFLVGLLFGPEVIEAIRDILYRGSQKGFRE